MGFFSAKATCAICGKTVGLNRFKIGIDAYGREIWKCPACTRKGGSIEIDWINGRARFFDGTLQWQHEFRNKCNVCGHVFCYTDKDLANNMVLAKKARADAVMGLAEAVAGTTVGSQLAQDSADRNLEKMKDYSRCPKCGSLDVRELNEEEWEAEKAKEDRPAETTAAVSAADEIRKFKDLLDSGVITQEEFDAKKKQLLGL